MTCNYRLTIEYDGSAFHGWQRQKCDRTVQGELEKALAAMTGKRAVVNGSGRTDAGVHALGQVANFRSDAGLEPQAFLKGLNSLLPDDIVIRSCERADDAFHARFDVKRKAYRYHILNRGLPCAVMRQYVWHIRKKLDAAAMREAARRIVGAHDFKSFEGAGSPRQSTVRRVFRSDVTVADPESIVYDIEADGFLRFMVRNLVGTLVEVGHARLTPDDFEKILLAGDRGLAGATAPPQGLFLVKVVY